MSGIHAMLIAGQSGGGGSGGGSGYVALNNLSVQSFGTGTRTAGYKVDSDGYVYTLRQAVYTQRHLWTPDPVANYEVRVTITDGTLTTGTDGAWLACSSDREWTVQDTDADDATEYAVLTVEIRSAATGTVAATCTVNLAADKSA